MEQHTSSPLDRKEALHCREENLLFGYVKNTNCPKTESDCIPCKSGEEFMDHMNDLDKCMRCRSCDRMLGAKMALLKRNVIQLQTLYAECKLSCNVSIVPTEAGMPPWGTAIIVATVVALLAAGLIFYLKRKQKHSIQGNGAVAAARRDGSYETLILIHEDVDLSHHIPDIVEEMTLDEVMAFVRHHLLPEPTIDDVLRDNWLNTSEQKIKLFQRWYQRHGMKEAYGTLISSLRDLKMRAVADKIEEKLKAAASSHQEKRLTYNDKTEQSKTCSQEGGKSYCNNAELSKTCPDSLEET
ncbi:hypothetical protein ASZ78_015109 [Callipepla squamata]|uniref:Death domain-containing protein n=1 Tax=Callipepla squamata TaxID=9009 RepID=A0A226MFF0_CALSU|nr:hypothetical protein ASZ78_015109 [Callipepla squamata]